MPGPDSSYSFLVIHIVWKVESDDKIEPPIHTEYLRSGGAIILILIVDGANAVISFCILSAIPETIIKVQSDQCRVALRCLNIETLLFNNFSPGYIVVPPESTELAYKSFRMSTSHFMIELYTVS